MKMGVFAATAVLALSLAPAAFASGGGGGGGGGGGYGGAAGFERIPNPAAEAYARGQRVFRSKFACKECEYGARFKDKAQAKAAATEVMNRANAGELSLSEADRDDLVQFLVQRYKLL